MVTTEQSVLPASVWAATAIDAPAYHLAKDDMGADVIVVGSGYTGLSAALHLAQGGKKVVIVEASEPGWGASGRNGGQIIAGLKYTPDALREKFGEVKGTAIATSMAAAADLVADLIQRYRIDCHPTYSGYLLAATSAARYESVALPRFRGWKAWGVESRLLDRNELANMIGANPKAYYGGWHDPRGGILQPLSYARGLAAAAIDEGATILAFSPARKIRQEGTDWVVHLDRATVRAPQVILATNAYTDDLWPGLRQSIVPVTSFQIATYPLEPVLRQDVLPGMNGVTDTRRLLNYFRLDHQGRVLFGGRSPVDDNPTLAHATSLRTGLGRVFPQLRDLPIQFVWSGKVALTKDTLPHVHILAPGLYTALGCNGRGVAVCTAIGKVMAQLIAGTEVPDLGMPVTAPDRYLFHAVRKAGILALSQYYRLLDSLDSAR